MRVLESSESQIKNIGLTTGKTFAFIWLVSNYGRDVEKPMSVSIHTFLIPFGVQKTQEKPKRLRFVKNARRCVQFNNIRHSLKSSSIHFILSRSWVQQHGIISY